MTPINQRLRFFGVATIALATLIAPGGLSASAATEPADPTLDSADIQRLTPPGVEGLFTSVAPARVFDTRNNNGNLLSVPTKRLAPGSEIEVDLADLEPIGQGQIVQAVALNLTAVNAQAGGYVVAYECGTPTPTSNINVQPGVGIANAAIVGLPQGANKVCFKSSVPLDLAVDMTGFFSIAVDDASTYVPIKPERIFDTRNGKQSIFAIPLGKRKSGDVIKVPITDLDLYRNGDEPVAIDLRVTTTDSASRGYVVAYPCVDGAPTSSTVNLAFTEARTNSAIIPVDTAGDICVKAMGETHIILDVTGYFTAGSGGYFYVPVEPIRALDTRPNFPGELTSPNSQLNFDVITLINLGSLDYNDMDAKAVTANVTTTNASGKGHLRAWPTGQTPTDTSIHNYPAGPIARASSSILGLGDGGSVSMTTSHDTDVIIDVTGIFVK